MGAASVKTADQFVGRRKAPLRGFNLTGEVSTKRKKLRKNERQPGTGGDGACNLLRPGDYQLVQNPTKKNLERRVTGEKEKFFWKLNIIYIKYPNVPTKRRKLQHRASIGGDMWGATRGRGALVKSCVGATLVYKKLCGNGGEEDSQGGRSQVCP